MVIAGLSSLLCCGFDFNRQTPVDVRLDSGVNPNTADFESLVRLPSIGPARAKAIIEYRRQTDGAAFENADDLQKIKGIGPKTVDKIRDYLYFNEKQGKR